MVYTTRFSGGRGGRNHLEHELRGCNIVQKNSRPNHPTTCGKVERFQQTMKNWLRAQPDQPATIAELQALLDTFVDDLQPPPPAPLPAPPSHPGHHLPRPTQSHAPPPTATATPTTASAPTGRPARLRHPARRRPTPPHRHRPNPRRNPRHPARPGPPRPRRRRRHRRTPPRTHHRPTHATTSPPADHPDPPPRNRTPEPTIVGPGVADVLRHHTVGLTGFEPATPCPPRLRIAVVPWLAKTCSDLQEHPQKTLPALLNADPMR